MAVLLSCILTKLEKFSSLEQNSEVDDQNVNLIFIFPDIFLKMYSYCFYWYENLVTYL